MGLARFDLRLRPEGVEVDVDGTPVPSVRAVRVEAVEGSVARVTLEAWGEVTVEIGIWVVWALFATALAYAGPANPVRETPLDRNRVAIGVLTFVVGVLCFMPIPFRIIT